MKLKTIFKNSDFLKVNKIISLYYYKQQVDIIRFFKSNPQAKPEKGTHYNYLLFLKNTKYDLNQISFEEFEELFYEYKNSVLLETLKRYKAIFNEIIKKPDIYTDYTIVFKKEKGEIEPYQNTNYIDVSGIKESDSDGQKYALEFVNWDEWANMLVSEKTISQFSFEEICAHTLYEMTFLSFYEDEIEIKKQDADRIFKEIDEIISKSNKDKDE
tara:strand:- start:895 stop:1536 length:642 start_codon:yes stop_codon:yes gene_type:complete